MSHFTVVKTEIKDQVRLEESLRQLHYEFRVGERLPIRGWQNNREFGQVVIPMSADVDIGFQRQPDANYAVIADWWKVHQESPLREQTFIEQINRTYADLTIDKLIEEDYKVWIPIEDKIYENGERVIVLSEPY